MKALPSLLLCALITLTPSITFAEYKIATVDVTRVLNESKDAVKKKKEFDKVSSKAKGEIESKRNALKKLEEKLKSANLKSDSAEVEQFRRKAREYSLYVKDTEEELREKFLKLNKSLAEDALEEISKYAKANDLDLILDKSTSPRGPVLFGNPSVDITGEIISRING